MRKATVLIAGMLFVAFLSCSKKSTHHLPASVQHLLDSEMSCACKPYLNEYVWRGETIYVCKLGGPSCDPVAPYMYYYANGDSTTSLEPDYTHEQFLQESHFVKNWYSCPGSDYTK